MDNGLLSMYLALFVSDTKVLMGVVEVASFESWLDQGGIGQLRSDKKLEYLW